MKAWPLAAALLAVGCALRPSPRALSPDGAPAEASRSLREGVYTLEQSRRGQEVFSTTCARCHKAEMTGSQIVPPLVGAPFLTRWARKTVGDLFEKVSTSMPPGRAASRLSPQDYADVLAYILSRNGFPSGGAELVAEFSALQSIRIAPDSGEPESGAPSATMAGPQDLPANPDR